MTDQGHQRLRTPAAGNYLGYATSTLEKKRLTGDGPPFIRLGRAIVYDTRDLDDWLSSRRATSTSDITGAMRCKTGLTAEETVPGNAIEDATRPPVPQSEAVQNVRATSRTTVSRINRLRR